MTGTRVVSALLGAGLFANLLACTEEEVSMPLEPDAGFPLASSDGGDAGTLGVDFQSFDEALKSAIAEHNQTATEKDTIKGASAVVVDKRLGIVHAAGYLDFAPDRTHLLASASKILSVGVLMRLADQGVVELDRPIRNYLADWTEVGAGDVTLAQLMSNSSGLASLREVSGSVATMSPPELYLQACQYSDVFTLSQCGQWIYMSAPPRKPDTEFSYGGSAWQLAGVVAEKASGKSWAQLVRETYEPCGVTSLGYTNQFQRAGDPFSYPAFFSSANPADLPVTENPNIEGGGYINALDYGKLLWMHLRGGTCGDTRVLSEAAVARMQEDRVKAAYGGTATIWSLPDSYGYGLGWWVMRDQPVLLLPGAYGSFVFIDKQREYAAFIALEISDVASVQIATQAKLALDALYDARPTP